MAIKIINEEELTIKEFEGKISEIPLKIAKMEVKQFQLSLEKEELAEQIKNIQESLLEDIAIEVTEEGKKKYSNETLRKIEMKKRLTENKAYVEMTDRLKAIIKDMSMNEITYNYLKRVFRNAEIFALSGRKED